MARSYPKKKVTFSLSPEGMRELHTIPDGWRSAAIEAAIKQIARFYAKHGSASLGPLLQGEFEIVQVRKQV